MALRVTISTDRTDAVKITEELKKNPKVLWVEFRAGQQDLAGYFGIWEERSGDVIASFSVWESWEDARKFIEGQDHSRAIKSHSRLFEDRKTKGKVGFYIDDVPNSDRMLELSRPIISFGP